MTRKLAGFLVCLSVVISLVDSCPAEDFDAMQLTLQGYKAGIESFSLPQVLRVWPSLDRHRQAALKEVFKYLRSIAAAPTLGMVCVPPAAIGESVWVECLETLTYTDAKGKTTQVKPAYVSVLFSRDSGIWTVKNMKDTRPKSGYPPPPFH